ncbi:hypothetical protein MP638_002014 [Amoeboaphelidium occidentale]|nr:hypothetical protein MP638_002014 [Amoeboaphelidium occidentale]
MKLNNLVLSALLCSITLAVELNRDILDITSAVNSLGYNDLSQTIPRVVVFGDQSSAKSSFVEALTGFQMPKADGETTTVAPIQIVTKNNHRFDFMATITLEKQREKVNSLEKLSDKIHEFQLESLRAWKDSSAERENDGFSENPVSVEIQGKTVKDMVVTDMPGFVLTEANRKQIEDMMEKQLNNPASVLVATRECRETEEDMNQSSPARMEKKLMDAGKRTLHIITKPDNCDNKELEIFLKRKFSQKNSDYYIVYTHPLVLNKTITEEAYFENDAPDFMKDLYEKYPERFSVKNVAKAVSKTLNERFGVYAEVLQSKLRLKAAELDLETKRLDETRRGTKSVSETGPTIASIINYILGIESGSNTNVVNAIGKDQHSFGNWTENMRLEIVKLEADLRHKTRNSIPFYFITRPKVNGETQSISRQETEERLKSEFANIQNVFFRTYNTEQFFSGTFEHVQSAIMNSAALQRAHDAMKDWDSITVETVQNVAEEYKARIKQVIVHALNETFGNNEYMQDLLKRVGLQVDSAASAAKTHASKVVEMEKVRRMNSNTELLEALLNHYSRMIQECVGKRDNEAVKKAVKEVSMVGSASAGAFSVAVAGAKVAGAVTEGTINTVTQTFIPMVPKMFGHAAGSAVSATITGLAVPVIGAGSLAYLGLRMGHEAGKKLHESIIDWKRRRANVDYNNDKNFESAMTYLFKKELEKSEAQGNVDSFTFNSPKDIPLPLVIAVFAQETAFLHYSHSRVNDAVQLTMNYYLKNNLARSLEVIINEELSRSNGIKGQFELSCENQKACKEQIKDVQEALGKVTAFINTSKRSTF